MSAKNYLLSFAAILLATLACALPISHDYRMLIVASCNAFAYYSGSPDTLSESLLKSSSGPAIIASPPNHYLFLMYLREGQSVGQAFWRSAELSGGSAVLLGDPSLTVLPKPPGN